jgi:formate dehydrogenase subunit delta
VSALTRAEARMGNDIARQFAHLPAPQAAEAIARHIETFWDPRMRQGLEALVAEGDDSLDPLLVDATGRLAAHASRSEPDAQP